MCKAENKVLFQKKTEKSSISFPAGYKFNREEIYDRFGETLSYLGRRNKAISERDVKADVSRAISQVRMKGDR